VLLYDRAACRCPLDFKRRIAAKNNTFLTFDLISCIIKIQKQMKKTTISKKLNLNKKTVSPMDSKEMNPVQGGLTEYVSLPVENCLP